MPGRCRRPAIPRCETKTFESPEEDGPERRGGARRGDRPGRRFDEEKLRSALLQAAAGIRALHAAGKLHRDIKSSNVLVTRDRIASSCSTSAWSRSSSLNGGDQSLAMAGTPAYMSPEQGAGLPISEASDWYSFGVMLYESLRGTESVFGKQRRDPSGEADPRTATAAGARYPAFPKTWIGCAAILLRRDPRRRPAGAEIVAQARRKDPALRVAHPAGPIRAGPFVGREHHLARLREAFRRVEEGSAVTVAVHGGSGMGKSALVRRFFETLQPTPGRDPGGSLLRKGVGPLQGAGQSHRCPQPLSQAPSALARRNAHAERRSGAGATLSGASARRGGRRRAPAGPGDPGCPGAAAAGVRSLPGADGEGWPKRALSSSSSMTCTGETWTARRCSRS